MSQWGLPEISQVFACVSLLHKERRFTVNFTSYQNPPKNVFLKMANVHY